MNRLLVTFGTRLATYLSAPRHVHGACAAPSIEQLQQTLQPGDVLLIEGNSRISTAVKYLTQSTWSHAALYVGPVPFGGNKAGPCFVEADLVAGVRSVGFEEFAGFPTRVCRPVGLTETERGQVAEYAIARIGHRYDLRNVVDLVRYLFPTPPVPLQFRRRILALGSGDPTRAICSTFIAQAFQSIRYPVLPIISLRPSVSPDCPGCLEEILRVRHHSLFTPRDFDVSPYFEIVKPALSENFDFRELRWEDDMAAKAGVAAADAIQT